MASPTPVPIRSSLENVSMNYHPPPPTAITTNPSSNKTEFPPLLDWKKNEFDTEDEGEREGEDWWERGSDGEEDKIEIIGEPFTMPKSEFVMNIIAILVISIIGEASRGLTVATLPLYMSSLGGNSLSYTMTVSFFSVGRVVGGMSLGYLSHTWPVRNCVIIALCFGIVGNVMYFFAISFAGEVNHGLNNSVMPTTGVLIAFLGRFIVGYGSTCVIIVRVLIAQITYPKDRTQYFGWANACQFVGSSLLPGLAVLLLALPEYHPANTSIAITGYNSPGLLQAFLNLAGIPFVLVFMTPLSPEISVSPPKIEKKIVKENGGKKGKGGEKEKEKVVEGEGGLLQTVGGYLWIFFSFDTRSAVSFIETSGTILYIQTLQPSCNEAAGAASMFFFYLGLGGFFVYFLCEYLDKVFSSLSLIQLSLLVTGVGFLLQIFDLGSWVFILACTLIWSVGSPISQVMLISSFSRLLGTKPQGKMQGAIASGGSLGRIIAPFVVGAFLYDCWGCPGQPEHCDLESLGLPDGTVPDHTNYIFYISSGLTFFALFLLTGFKLLLEHRGKDFLDQINASERDEEAEGRQNGGKKNGYGTLK